MSITAAPIREIFDLTALDVLVRRGFQYAGYDYVGVRAETYKSDEKAWDEDDAGRWKSSPSPTTTASTLSVTNGTYEPPITDLREGVWRVSSGTAPVFSWGLMYDEPSFASSSHSAAAPRVIIWDANRTVVSTVTPAASPLTASVLSDGSYIVGVSLTLNQTHLTESKYEELTGSSVDPKYKFVEGGVNYFFDYILFLGTIPSDPNHELNVKRREAVTAGTTQDKSNWIYFISSLAPWSSEYAMIKLQMGAGTWSALSPLPALHRDTISNTTTGKVTIADNSKAAPFDPFARSVASFLLASDGNAYVAGDRTTDSGLETALWKLNSDGSGTLVGTSPQYSTGFCECAGLISAHEGRRLIEVNGNIFVGTLCSNFIYNPNGDRVEDRLVPTPYATKGRPGGRSHCAVLKTAYWTTEAIGVQASSDSEFAEFYDTLESQSGKTRDVVGATGVVAHVDGNLTVYGNKVHGIVQDKPFSDDDAKQFVANWTAFGWKSVAGMGNYPAADIHLQRVARIGPALIAYGKKTDSEDPVFYMNDGKEIAPYSLNYRMRETCEVFQSSGYTTGYAPAFLPDDNFSGMRVPRRLVEIRERTPSMPETNGQDAFNNAIEGCGDPVVFYGILNGYSINGIEFCDVSILDRATQTRYFESLFNTHKTNSNTLVWFRIDSSADQDDLSSYIYPLDKIGYLQMLEKTGKKIESMVLLPCSADKITPPWMVAMC